MSAGERVSDLSRGSVLPIHHRVPIAHQGAAGWRRGPVSAGNLGFPRSSGNYPVDAPPKLGPAVTRPRGPGHQRWVVRFGLLGRHLCGGEPGSDAHAALPVAQLVTHLAELGWAAKFIQDQVGHSHAATTPIYMSVGDDFKDRLVRAAIDEQLAQLGGGG
jgi:hypothetical protein